ncbi:MAG TPA: hypothetical protein VGP94_09645 [Tepidisphaeraceae bacterium]|nr:hypothetical protein [Tepidisphaeraceae bacterium]
MPLVPLFDETEPRASSHNVRSPGGYETWRLRAYDAKQDLLLLASLWNGYLFHPTYHKRYGAYLRHPTRTVPPLPSEYACQELILYQNGRLIFSSITPLPPVQSFPVIQRSGLRLSLGSCHLDLEPHLPPTPLYFETIGPRHRWCLANPLLKVDGALQLPSLPKLIINAIACHDHRYGTEPIITSSPSWYDGCALFPGCALLFEGTPTTSWLMESTLRASQFIDHPVDTTSYNRSLFGIRYPQSFSLADQGTLTNPRILHSSPIRLHVSYDAKSPTESGRAFVEIFHPHRLRWRLLNFFLPSPRGNDPPLTWSPIPPADKSSPSAPECARAPSSSP